MHNDQDFVRGPRGAHFAENLEEFTAVREASKRVPCSHCHAPVGVVCTNDVTGEDLKRFPAHCCRRLAAKETK